MKLISLDQTIFIPVVDETHGGVTVEMKMTVGEFFGKCCQGFEPEAVEAIPVEWLRKQMALCHENSAMYQTVNTLLHLWQKEQEAR